MKKTNTWYGVLTLLFFTSALQAQVHTSYLWHMDQPIYWGEKSKANPNRMQLVKESEDLKTSGDAWNIYSDGKSHPLNNLMEIFSKDDRVQAYQWRPKNSVQAILGQPDAGAQVSISGCLMQNINSLGQANQWGYSSTWYNDYKTARGWTTSDGFPRLDVVSFSHDHAFSPLVSERTLRMQIRAHKAIYAQYYGNTPVYSKGYWPAECAFSERIIKALVQEGLEWSVIANSHLARTLNDYPLNYGTSGCNIDPPNRADKVPTNGTNWWSGQIDGRGGTFAAPYCYQAHKAKYVDPETGTEYKITVVPMCDLMSYQDGYSSMSTSDIDAHVAPFNNPNQNSIVLLAHDGDNAFGGGYSYYQESVPSFVNAAASKGYKPTTIQQFLFDNPVPETDVVHVEDGAWVNADSDWGHPQYINWLWPLYDKTTLRFNPDGWTEDARNWAVVTAIENYVTTAEDLEGGSIRADHVANANASSTNAEKAWHFYFGALNSGYMYYGKSIDMEVKQTVAGNNAISFAQNVLNANPGVDNTKPTIFNPQRFPYNPGGKGFGPLFAYKEKNMPSNFHVWTYVYDVSDLDSVVLMYRTDVDGVNPLSDNINDTYAGGNGVGAWKRVTMTKRVTETGNVANDPEIDFFILPTAIANMYYGEIKGLHDTLVDYYVEAYDKKGNVGKSAIQHVWVGTLTEDGGGGGGGNANVSWLPQSPTINDTITITVLNANANTKLHWGVNPVGAVWTQPNAAYWPAGTVLHNGTGPAVQTPFSDPDGDGKFTVKIPPFNNAAQVVQKMQFVLYYPPSTWDNNGGNNYNINVSAVVSGNPVGGNATVASAVNTNYTFKNADFPFTGYDATTFAGIKIISVETAGDLEYSGVDVTADTDYATVGNLVFKPATDAVGTPYATFTFKVKDSQGRYSDATYTCSINVTNNNPTSANSTVTTQMNVNYTFSTNNFTFVGKEGATFAGIKIVSLETAGDLEYNNVDVAANTDYASVNLLVFKPAANGVGTPYASFTFKVKDSQGRYSDAAYTCTINVSDNAPTGGDAMIVTLKNTAYTFSTSDFPFTGVAGNIFAGIKLINIPDNGSLKYNGNEVTADTDYPDAGLLSFTPATDATGYPYSTFMFKVKDNMGNYSAAEYSMTVAVVQTGVTWLAANPTDNQKILVSVHGNANISANSIMHWGVNTWTKPINAYWPANSVLHTDNVAVRSTFKGPKNGILWLEIGPFNNPAQAVTVVNFTINYGNGQWQGTNYNININNPSTTWSGTMGASWFDAANWSNGVPNVNTDAVIPVVNQYPDITSIDAVCDALTVNASASLNIQVGGGLKVGGILTNNGTINIASSPNGTGSLIDNGTISGTGIFNVERSLLSPSRYYYVSSPMAAAKADVFGTTAQLSGTQATDRKLYEWTSSGWNRIQDQNTVLTPLKGYAYKTTTTSNEVYTFTGTPNTGNKTLSLNFNNNGSVDFYDFNLVGNPYPSAIDWGLNVADGWDNVNVGSTIWLREGGSGGNSGGGNFLLYNRMAGVGTGSRYIAPMQAFWIEATGTGASLGVSNAARLHSSQAFVKTQQQSNGVAIKATRNGLTDHAFICFNNSAAATYETYDSRKFFATDKQYPQIYTMLDNNSLSINTYHALSDNMHIPLGFMANESGEYTISADIVNGFNASNVYLEDKTQGLLIDLLKESYTFTSDVVDNSNRFVIHFTKTTTGIKDSPSPVKTYAFGKTVYVSSVLNGVHNIEITDVLGKVMYQGSFKSAETAVQLNTNGYYFVRVTAGNHVTTQKVMIQ